MRFLHGFGVGTITRDGEIKHSDNGDEYVDVLVQFDEHAGKSGVPYSQRIGFRSFQPHDIARVSILRRGSILGFEGTVDAVITSKGSGVYANPRVTGRIMHVAEVAP